MVRRPRKWVRDLVHVVLGRRSPRQVRQSLPPYQEQTEQIIAWKFIRTLNERFSRNLSAPVKSTIGAFPDCYCREDGQKVGIELVEVTTEADAKDYQNGYMYCQLIKDRLSSNLSALRGLHATIWPADTLQTLPAFKEEGQRLSKSLAELLTSKLSELRDLSPGCWLKIDWGGPNSRDPYLAIVVRRYGRPSASNSFVVEFAQRGESPAIIQSGLKEAIQRKIDKHYPPSGSEKLFLVAYERFWLARFTDDEAIKLAQSNLKVSEHPFDEVWYFYPIAEDPEAPDKPEGFLKQLWPLNGN